MLHCITHWPVCPGVFIAILGFLAAIVTFWDKPTRPVKVSCVVLFFGLMCVEVWMMSKDRDMHDEAEKGAREAELEQRTRLDVLTLQAAQSNSYLAEIDRKIATAKDPRLIATLQAQAKAARAEGAATSKRLLVGLVPSLVHQIRMRTYRFNLDMVSASDFSAYGPPSEMQNRQKVRAQKEELLKAKYYEEMETSLLPTADYLRQQLLQGQTLTSEDETEAAIFKAALNGDFTSFKGDDAAKYLDDLAKRVSPRSQ